MSERSMAEIIDTAVDCCYDVICHPSLYGIVCDRVKARERKRDEKSINSGRGPSMLRKIDVQWDAKQQDPLVRCFGDWREYRAYLRKLNEVVA